MRCNPCLPGALLLILVTLPAGAGAVKASPSGDGKTSDTPACCAGESAKDEGKGDKAICPRKNSTRQARKAAPKPRVAPAAGSGQASAHGSLAPAGAANMVVTKDPETGELRNATAEESAKLFAGRESQAAPADSRVVILPDGTEMVRLGKDTMNYAVATKTPDGSIRQSCVHGKDSATEARTAPKHAPTPRAEER